MDPSDTDKCQKIPKFLVGQRVVALWATTPEYVVIRAIKRDRECGDGWCYQITPNGPFFGQNWFRKLPKWLGAGKDK